MIVGQHWLEEEEFEHVAFPAAVVGIVVFAFTVLEIVVAFTIQPLVRR